MDTMSNTNRKPMTVDAAREMLGFTTPKSPTAQAALAASRLANMTTKVPLRYKVACQILINDADRRSTNA